MKLTNMEKLEALLNKKLYVKGFGSQVIALINELTGEHMDADFYKEYPFFYMRCETGKFNLYGGYNMSYFVSCALEEISIEEVLKMQEHEFKPYERVLVRDYDSQAWHADLFSHVDNTSIQFESIGGKWNQCIPYEGNEHLLGKTK